MIKIAFDPTHVLYSTGHPDPPLMFWCDGCNEPHGVWASPNKNPKTGAEWKWNGDMVRPTFEPSLDVMGLKMPGGRVIQPRCHSIITNGSIAYLQDCEHKLAGKTVALRANPFKIEI